MATYTSQSRWPLFILFGDSLSQFSFNPVGDWGSQVACMLQRKCDILNRGFAGYNSRWCKLMIQDVITKEIADNVAGITIFLGANDSTALKMNPRQHVPLTEFRDNIKEIVQYLMSLGINKDKIIIISPPVYNHDAWKAFCDDFKMEGLNASKTMEITKQYADASIEVAKETGVNSLDLFTEMSKQENWKELLSDGLHFSVKGSKFLFQLLQPMIEKLTADIKPEFPAWDEVDYYNPSVTFRGKSTAQNLNFHIRLS